MNPGSITLFENGKSLLLTKSRYGICIYSIHDGKAIGKYTAIKTKQFDRLIYDVSVNRGKLDVASHWFPSYWDLVYRKISDWI